MVFMFNLAERFSGSLQLPRLPLSRLGDLWWALLVGLIAGVIGIMYKLIFGIVNLVFIRLTKRPVVRAIIGGVILGLIGSFLPLTLYSGQDQLLQIIHNPATFGIGILLLLLLVKTVMTSTSFATGFVGGPVFPLLFIGGTLGLAISKILTFIPEGVAVTAGMAGVACAVFPLPLTIIFLLGVMGGQTDLLPGIAIGAVVGLLVSKALTPLLRNARQSRREAVMSPKQLENISSSYARISCELFVCNLSVFNLATLRIEKKKFIFQIMSFYLRIIVLI